MQAKSIKFQLTSNYYYKFINPFYRDRRKSMQSVNTGNYQSKMSNTLGPGRLIKFPTITKLIYDGESSDMNKTLFKSTNAKLTLKNATPPLPIGALTQTNSFRVVEVPPHDHVINICTMSINEPKFRTVSKSSEYDTEKQTSNMRTVAMTLLRKQKSSLILTKESNSLSRKGSLASVNKMVEDNANEDSSYDQLKTKNRTQSLIKFKAFQIPQNKISMNEIYAQVVMALALVNGNVIINQSKNFQRIRRAKIDKGNNGALVKQTVKKRTWWNTTEESSEANMIWTQKTVRKMNVNQQFYAQITEEQEKYVTFQRNIDQALMQYPKMLQLFFTDSEITKMSNPDQGLSSKYKKLYPIFSLLSNKKATRKIMPELAVLYNHIPNNFEISSKKMLYKNLWRYYHEVKKDPYQFIPKTYHLTAFDWQEKIQFIRSEQKKLTKPTKNDSISEAWFLKPGQNTNRGKGIQMFKSTSEVLDYIMRNPPKSTLKTYILQQYINPLLYDSRKFDIRCYLLCIQIFDVQTYYWYEQGYIRTSSSKFTMNKTSVSIHLTNDAVQKQFDNYDKYESANKLSYFQIDKYLKNQYGYDFLQGIVPRMKKITVDVCKSAIEMGKMRGNEEEQRQEEKPELESPYAGLYFEVFGLDFIISREGDPFLLEVNTNPCLQINSNLLSRIIPQLIENTFRIVTDVYLPNKCAESKPCPDWAQSFIINNKFSLIYRRDLRQQWESQKQQKKSEKLIINKETIKQNEDGAVKEPYSRKE